MPGVIGLDVGGANTKAVWRNGDAGRTVSRPFEISSDRDALGSVLHAVVGDLGAEAVELVALSMTAELAGAFAGKREGVGVVLDAVEAAIGERVRLLVFTTAGELVSLAAARARPGAARRPRGRSRPSWRRRPRPAAPAPRRGSRAPRRS